MIEVTVKNINKVSNKIKDLIEETLKSKKNRDEMGRLLVHQMIGLAKKGIEPKSGNKFKTLKSSTIKSRQRHKSLGKKTSKVFNPTRSNLSLTGELLDSVKHFSPKQSTIIKIVATGNRNKKLSKTHMRGDKNKNIPARPFVGINKSMKKDLTNILKRQLRRSLTKFNRRK